MRVFTRSKSSPPVKLCFTMLIFLFNWCGSTIK
ncbi:hypothetical protein TSMEX_005731 [Taenia solium]|eukprot:TsM_000805800 transcript=TsM_000805800 gene=TsM_000805800